MTDWQSTPARPRIPVVGIERDFIVGRVWCVGRNYRAHTAEMGGDPQKEEPFFFLKPWTSVAVQPSTIRYPPNTSELHHEVELYVAIGLGGRCLDADSAAASILGYGLAVDLTRRDVQARAKARRRPWALAKGFDQAAPLSELILGLPAADSGLQLSVNGEERQRGQISQMTLSPIELLMELSEQVSMEPGDIILTGTPAGVGSVQVGDEVRARLGSELQMCFTLS